MFRKELIDEVRETARRKAQRSVLEVVSIGWFAKAIQSDIFVI